MQSCHSLDPQPSESHPAYSNHSTCSTSRKAIHYQPFAQIPIGQTWVCCRHRTGIGSYWISIFVDSLCLRRIRRPGLGWCLTWIWIICFRLSSRIVLFIFSSKQLRWCRYLYSHTYSLYLGYTDYSAYRKWSCKYICSDLHRRISMETAHPQRPWYLPRQLPQLWAPDPQPHNPP